MKFSLFAQPIRHQQTITRKPHGQQLTVLDELKSISNAALVGHKEKTTWLGSGVRLSFVFGYFGAELNTTAENSTLLGAAEFVQVGSGVRLARMRCERASL